MEILKDSFWSFILQMAGAALNFSSVIIITIYYNSSILGSYTLFMTLVVVTSFFTQFNSSEALEKKVAEKKSVPGFMMTSAVFSLSISTIILFAFFIFMNDVRSYIGVDITIAVFILIIPSFAIFRIMLTFLNGKNKIVSRSLVEFINIAIRVVLIIICILIGLGTKGIIWSYGIGIAVSTIISIGYYKPPFGKPSYKHLRRLSSYSIYSWSTMLKGTAWVWMDTAMLGLFVDNNLIGIYELVWRITGVLFFAGMSLARVIFPAVNESILSQSKENVSELISMSLTMAGIIAIPGTVGLVLLGENILTMISPGISYGYYPLIILSSARIVHSYGGILTRALNGLNKPRLTNISNISFIVVNILLNWILIPRAGLIGAALASFTSILLSSLIDLRFILRLYNINPDIREIFVQIVSTIIMAILIQSQEAFLTPLYTPLLITISVTVYILSVSVLSEEINLHRFIR